jgi:hypothetical protein
MTWLEEARLAFPALRALWGNFGRYVSAVDALSWSHSEER